MTLLCEVCVDSATGALVAQEAGADRVELCANLLEGGVTPSLGSIAFAREHLEIPIMVLVRPRGGDFVYSEAEVDMTLRDIEICKQHGVDGVVVGALRIDGTIDLEQVRAFVHAARPMQVTHHRAFDMCVDPRAALGQLIDLGVDRVLSSGQAGRALDGVGLLTELVAAAGDRISVMPGGGIEEADVAEVVARTGCREVHFAALGSFESPMQWRNPGCGMGCGEVPGEYDRRETDAGRVAEFLVRARGAARGANA